MPGRCKIEAELEKYKKLYEEMVREQEKFNKKISECEKEIKKLLDEYKMIPIRLLLRELPFGFKVIRRAVERLVPEYATKQILIKEDGSEWVLIKR